MKKDFTQQNFLKKNLGGFTLIEMLVAMTIFVIVITIASTIFVHAIRAQRLNLAYQELLDQTSYVMEYMSRSIRMAMKDDITVWGLPGSERHCLTGDNINYATGTVSGASCLQFRNYKNECQYFCLDGTKLVTATTTSAADPVIFTDLTSPNLTVYSFNVGLLGKEQPPADYLQPLVIINLEIEGREGARIEIQTSISQRNLDVEKP